MQAALDATVVSGERLLSPAVAARIDAADAGVCRRDEFLLPPTEGTARIRTPGSPSVYLCGNSLGLQPKRTRAYITEELDKWGAHGVEGHFKTARPWVTIDETVRDASAALVGAVPSEVVVMNSLTVNLHLLMVSFYVPVGPRVKILLEEHAFPSDTYAVASQVLLHGGAPSTDLILVKPRAGEETLRTEDITAAIAGAGSTLALVLLPGVQYYTGQLLDIPTITAAAHAVGAIAGWDLAHAVGNVPLHLHDWGVDFAAWCTYKYMNSGPGGIGGAFVHERHAECGTGGGSRPRLAGWWGHRKEDRFKMGSDFIPTPGASGWQLSNPPVFQTAALRASLDVFTGAGGMGPLRERALVLTRYLELLLQAELGSAVSVLTPSDPSARGCQLSLSFTTPVKDIARALGEEGVIIDTREVRRRAPGRPQGTRNSMVPSVPHQPHPRPTSPPLQPYVMRVAPAPLYNTAEDVRGFVDTLAAVLREGSTRPTKM